MSVNDKINELEQAAKHHVKPAKIGVLLFSICWLLLILGTTIAHVDKWRCHDGTNSWWRLLSSSSSNCKELTYIEDTQRRIEGNNTCTIVACHTPNTVGTEIFWSFYSQQGYSAVITAFEDLQVGGVSVHPTWCRILAALKEAKRNPRTRVIYLDIDTRIDVDVWCNMPHLGKQAPIIMTSLHRSKVVQTDTYKVHGTQVQANAFIVTPGRSGVKALLRWQNTYTDIAYRDQGVIHLREQGICGVPGWIHCYGNPEQQSRHCAGRDGDSVKEACIAQIFK